MPEAEQYQQYEVLRREDGSLWELGRGAMGITYKAYDTNLHCTVALKVINSTYLQNDTARQRFLREARAAAALRHPNVASVFNLSTHQDNYFYVMEFIDGETVEARVKRKGRLEPVEALNITLQVSRALAAAAKQRLVHRDLKPANLMLVDQEGEQIVKVIDFGLAKSAKDAGEDTGTLTMGGFVGTPHFASPEQVEEGDLDVRSDIYSLGATLYFMIAGKAPFSGSVGQVMSQHLYKPIDIEPLTGVLSCVISLIRSMLEKDRTQRPQTPRDLQNAIVACLEEIRGHSTRFALEGVDEPPQSLGPRTLLLRNYRLIEELRESPEGRHFLAEDIRGKRMVRVLILRPDLVSDSDWLAALQTAVERLRTAPFPMLRAVYSLERGDGYSILLEEHVVGPSLLDLLRSRSVLSAPEVVRLLNLLAPLADHARAHQLEYVDFTLQGIDFVNTGSTSTEIQPDLLRRPLTTWERIEPKVNAIDFSFAVAQASTLTGMETRMQGAANGGPRDSYVRSLALLAYELLGGQRARVEATGRYNPIAALTRDGNAVLRRGLIDEYSSAAELAGQLANAAGVRDLAKSVSARKATVAASAAQVIPSSEPVTPESLHQTVSAEASAGLPSKRPLTMGPWQWILLIGLAASVGIGSYLIYLRINQSQEFVAPSQELATLAVQSDPPGASILLDGKPAPGRADTFNHVPFGTHQLTATLNDYEPLKQNLEVRRGMAPEVHLKLKPLQEIASLSVQSDPPGASILLDGKPPSGPSNSFAHVPFGTHQLTAMLNDYEPIKQDLEVRRGMAPEIRLKLKPLQEIASLSVQSDPPGASILLDGKPPQGPSNTFSHVAFGPHQLTATLDDYEPIRQNLEVRRGMAREIHLKLDAKKYETGSPEQIAAYVRRLQSKAPNSEELINELGRIIEQLRSRIPPVGKEEFSISYRDVIKDAADLNILSAILWSADYERGREAFNLFLRAAKLGDPSAMMNVGRLYLYKGTPADDDQAFGWLKKAYESPNPNLEAGAYLGFCYLNGRGTKKDVKEGKKLIMSLANQNVVFAMTQAGILLATEANGKREEAIQRNRQQLSDQAAELDVQARQWWERAANKSDWNASARLGLFYQEGLGGLKPSDEEAEKRFQEGIKHENNLSKYYYAQFLLEKKPNRRSEAESLMSQAATAGIPSAKTWCKENHVNFSEVATDDERQ
jgi:TPR repeat protein/tRNA A-37 threonylcarbamoyl transferase component Bud32